MVSNIQWSRPSNADTMGTAAECPEYGGIHVSEASSIFLVGVPMRICAVECYEAAFQSSPLLYVG